MALAGACGQTDDRAAPEVMRTDGGELGSGCSADVECPQGMVCGDCGDGARGCVPGCRVASDCRSSQVCEANVLCLTCPCAPGWCVLNPCRDVDSDGFVPGRASSCPGKQVGDCDDLRDDVYPGSRELCRNGTDDDCDGRVDARDTEDCDASCDGRYCNADSSCGSGAYCERGCCQACPAHDAPRCATGECLAFGGVDPRGCALAPVCAACDACPGTWAPVCSDTFATFRNGCAARLTGAGVLHDGECLPEEGARCSGDDACGEGQLCRDTCPACEAPVLRCAKVGTCAVDADCDRVPSVAVCADGAAPWVCVAGRCSVRCP